MKFLISLGPNWEDASVRATRVTEKTVPATPIMVPDMVDNMLSAELGLFTRKKRTQASYEMVISLSNETKPIDKKTTKQIIRMGTNQKVAINSFQKKSSFFI